MKKEEMSFNLHLLSYAENKGTFQFKWSGEHAGRERESEGCSERGSGSVSSRVVLCDCPTAGISLPTVPRKEPC